MKLTTNVRQLFLVAAAACVPAARASAADSGPESAGQTNALLSATNAAAPGPDQLWNWHAQNTDIVDAHPTFPTQYSGPNSLHKGSEVRQTVSIDLLAGVRLWSGAEFHVDGLAWQGFGLSKTVGIENFPNNEAFRLGTDVPNINLPRVFARQIIGLGGEQEDVADDQLHLASPVDVSRVTLTVGKLSPKDIFDGNSYANDARTQFMSWGLVANEAWDYPADSLGYITGFAAELNQPQWTFRYGFFQMPRVSNGTALDSSFTRAWGMVTEIERRFSINSHPGAIRLLAYLNRAHMGSYEDTADNPVYDGDITRTRSYRSKYGFGLNAEQELAKDLGVFLRLGWSDGRNEAWVFSDVDYTASLGLSLKGNRWGRADDTFGVGFVDDGISPVHQRFLTVGGTGILDGDGNLNYGWEESLETYYDFKIWRSLHGAVDYEFVNNPAFNRDRGPVSVVGLRLHWEF